MFFRLEKFAYTD